MKLCIKEREEYNHEYNELKMESKIKVRWNKNYFSLDLRRVESVVSTC